MIVCPNGHPNPDGTTTCQVCDAYIDTTTAPPDPPPPVPPVLALADPSVRTTVGSQIQTQLHVRNGGSDPGTFVLEVLGEAAGWVVVEPSILSVAAGSTGAAVLTITPPTDSAVGVTTCTLRATPSDGASAEIELAVDVVPAPEVSLAAGLEPLVSKGTMHGDHTVAVDNLGSTPAIASLQGVDPSDAVTFGFNPPALTVAPGERVAARIRVSPRKPILLGRSRTFPFQVMIVPEAGRPIGVDGRMIQRPRVPLWWIAIAIAIAVVVIVPFRRDGGEELSFTRSVDFESPPLGAAEEEFRDPLSVEEVTFTTESDAFDDVAVGVVKNRSTSACVDPPDENQKLGTGRVSLGGIGKAAFPIRAEFTAPLHPGGGVVAISVEFQSLAGANLRLRLFDPTGAEVGRTTVSAAPPNGTCSFPGGPRARTVLTVEVTSDVAFAIMDEESGGQVFVVDDFTFRATAAPEAT